MRRKYFEIFLNFIFFLIYWEFTAARKLPSYIQVCKASDKNLEQCVMNSFEAMKPYLAKGIPKLRVPPLEPFHIPQLDINRNQDNLKVKARLKDIKAFGGSDFHIKRLKINVNKLFVDTTVSFPHLYASGEYNVDGRLLVIPLKGKGLFKGNLTDIVVDIKGVGETVTNKKGVKYLQIKSVSPKVRVGGQNLKLISKDADPNVALITQTASAFVSQNQNQVFEIVLPIVEETVEAFVKQIGNSILRTIPYHEIIQE